jgi:Uncharacterized domain/protein associated with RNAses G and E
MAKIIKMNSVKYNNFVNYEWDLTLIEKNDKYLIGKGEVNRKLVHNGKNTVFSFENPSVEFYPFGEFFTLSIEKTPNNDFNYYCNICMPPKLADSLLSFVDLDLDLIKLPGEGWKVVDEDEFEINSKKYNYPQWLIDKTIEEKDRLLDRISKRVFPFDGTIEAILLDSNK